MSTPKIEFSRPIEATRVNLPQKLTATPEECAEIAKRLGLTGVSGFEAQMVLKQESGGIVLVAGDVRARVGQTCVVSLESFDSDVAEPVEARFSAGDLSIYAEDDPDAPEPIMNGKIDLGELAVQTLSLALDPHPRKPGVVFQGYDK